MVGKFSPFYSGIVFPFLGTPKTPLLWCRVCRGSCYVRANFNNLQQVVFSLFPHSSTIDRQVNPIKVNHRFTTASTCSSPVHSSTVPRQFLGVRSWFARGSTPFCDSENTYLYPYKMGVDKSGRFEHLTLTRYHAVTDYRLTYQKLSTTGEVSSSHFVVSAKLRSQRLKVSARKSNA